MARNKIKLQDKIKTLEYLHDMLDDSAHEEKNNVKLMIDAYRAQNNQRMERYPSQKKAYIPPAL